MARAQFDKQLVIDKTVEIFWEHGYSGSSMQQVIKATGLKPGSIYLAFGSKEGLFREALESYAGKYLAEMSEKLESANSVGEGICAILEGIIEKSKKEDYKGCFLMKTQLELGFMENHLDELASEKLKEREVLFQSYLEKEYSPEMSKKRAISIMLHIFGLRVYGYQKQSAEKMRLGLQEGLFWLPWGK